jgi:hypothetical protein
MIKSLLIILIFFFCKSQYAQKEILVIGNYNEICFDTNLNIEFGTHLDKLLDYDIVLIFSGVISAIKPDEIPKIIEFISKGGSLYLGCDNWPFQAESNLILEFLFSFHSWGNFDATSARVSEASELTCMKEIPPGNSVAVFPLSPYFEVDVWVTDKPLIMSGSFERGILVVDGGYSRFYCSNWCRNSSQIFADLISYLRR